jgi:hypothetical protein
MDATVQCCNYYPTIHTTVCACTRARTPAGLRFAIIENEFGDISVDDKVLQEACDEEIVEVCLNTKPWTQNPRP